MRYDEDGIFNCPRCRDSALHVKISDDRGYTALSGGWGEVTANIRCENASCDLAANVTLDESAGCGPAEGEPFGVMGLLEVLLGRVN